MGKVELVSTLVVDFRTLSAYKRRINLRKQIWTKKLRQVASNIILCSQKPFFFDEIIFTNITFSEFNDNEN